ncbi:hypothetical protein HF324_19295 [Chitinophaga oryzae]|uniref:DUF4369 domain-containing protein n=1 Tax=Chitinophaga oryzae TaxID=2725414 RepID=A0AAE6ZHQ6_9BACT|nr:hypothetical protein [Chitinophaga oryzae]QJB33369.1 hypothetical protein HF329_19430 [Chitinophaga oryzae]QJB39887.1 hypothetical protein HF324_19295 [Chitinophaga oryzae]
MTKHILFSAIFVLACLSLPAQDSLGLSRTVSFRNAVDNNLGVRFGTALSFHPKDNTVGTPYLYADWGRLRIDSMDNKPVARSVVYDANLDLEKNMVIVKGGDGRAYAPEVNNVQALHFSKGEEQHAFVALQIDGMQKFVEQLAAGRYRLVKDAKVVFHPADFVDKGMVQSGKNYDEYKKSYTYYLVKDQAPMKVVLRKKQFLEALQQDPAAQAAARKFLSEYKGAFDETAARLAIEAVNK